MRALDLGMIIWSRSDQMATNRVRQPGEGAASSVMMSDAGAHLPGDRVRDELGRGGALVRRAERHERVDAGVPAHPLHEVARDQPAHRVPDHVHALVPGLDAHRLDEGLQATGDHPHVVGQRASSSG